MANSTVQKVDSTARDLEPRRPSQQGYRATINFEAPIPGLLNCLNSSTKHIHAAMVDEGSLCMLSK